MIELHEAAQELVDYYDGLVTKYGRIAEYKAVKTKMDRVKTALANTRYVPGVVYPDAIVYCDDGLPCSTTPVMVAVEEKP